MNDRSQLGSNQSVKPSGTIRVLQLAGLSGASGCVVVWWLRAPLLDAVGIQGWRAVGVLGAVVIGGIGVVAIGAWHRVSIAVALGLVAGATWAEFWLTDRAELIDSLVAGIFNHGQDVPVPGAAAALFGALVTQMVVSKTARCRRLDTDG